MQREDEKIREQCKDLGSCQWIPWIQIGKLSCIYQNGNALGDLLAINIENWDLSVAEAARSLVCLCS